VARIALYRKYRPKDFAEVGGQEIIVQTLLNAVKDSKFSHAYLFCGPRGIGKTSVARILAKAVNCKSGKNGNPCNKCEICESINEQNALDIIEIDAASNRGIDEIRDLREKVKFSPSELKYKVFIIDEVHMLTKEAFNALLKTLEEPPSHALFIMATTEIHKIPATVISRCQRFDFKRISEEELGSGLKKIAKKEAINLTEGATSAIARASEGGFRDAISILDQISMNSGGKEIKESDVTELLGIVDISKVQELLGHIERGEKEKALTFLTVLLEKGGDIGQLTKGLMFAYRERVKEAVKNNQETKDYVWAIEVLSDCSRNFKHSIYPQLSLEVGLLKIIDNYHTSGEETKKEVSETKQTNRPKKESEETGEKADFNWDKVLFEIKAKNNSIHAFVKESEPVIKAEGIELIFPYKFHKERIEDRKNKKVVEEAISKVSGREYNIICKVGAPKKKTTSGQKEDMDGLLDVLGGKVVE